MDSEHRHELQHNQLADWLSDTLEQAKPHALTLVGGTVAVLLAVFGWTWLSTAGEAMEDASWRLFTNAMLSGAPSPDDLEQAASFKDSSVADWASATWADQQLANAAALYFQDRATSNEALEKAKNAYQTLATKRGVPAEIRSRAELGIARSIELTGDVEGARKAYESVSGGMAEFAAAQAQRLSAPRAVDDYAWLKDAKPSALRSPLTSGTPAPTPDFAPDDIATPPETGDENANSDQSLTDILKRFGEETGDAEADPAADEGAESPDADAPGDGAPGDGAPSVDAPVEGAPAEEGDTTDEAPFDEAAESTSDPADGPSDGPSDGAAPGDILDAEPQPEAAAESAEAPAGEPTPAVPADTAPAGTGAGG